MVPGSPIFPYSDCQGSICLCKIQNNDYQKIMSESNYFFYFDNPCWRPECFPNCNIRFKKINIRAAADEMQTCSSTMTLKYLQVIMTYSKYFHWLVTLCYSTRNWKISPFVTFVLHCRSFAIFLQRRITQWCCQCQNIRSTKMSKKMKNVGVGNICNISHYMLYTYKTWV